MVEDDDLTRLRKEYSVREQRLTGKNLYSLFTPGNLFTILQRERMVLNVLRHQGFSKLSEYTILELGCGNGGVLTEFLVYGADPEKMHGVDFLFLRVEEAHHRLASCSMVNADGQCLPYVRNQFDLILQFTAFSSILDEKIKQNMANDMLRVLKPHGIILWYDFWLNPTNKQTKGICPSEIRLLFPGCQYEFHRITLAPPIARRIVPISWGLALFLESLKIFNSHYLVAIRPVV